MRYWLPPIIWTAFILLASSDLFSASGTGQILRPLLDAVFGPLDDEAFTLVHFAIRKSAHFAEYAILGALLFRALRRERSGWNGSWAAGAMTLAAAVAITDESLQAFSALRDGSPADVVLDLTGAAAAQLLLRIRMAARPPVLSSER